MNESAYYFEETERAILAFSRRLALGSIFAWNFEARIREVQEARTRFWQNFWRNRKP